MVEKVVMNVNVKKEHLHIIKQIVCQLKIVLCHLYLLEVDMEYILSSGLFYSVFS